MKPNSRLHKIHIAPLGCFLTVTGAAFTPDSRGPGYLGNDLIAAFRASTERELHEALYSLNERAFCLAYPSRGDSKSRTRFPGDLGFVAARRQDYGDGVIRVPKDYLAAAKCANHLTSVCDAGVLSVGAPFCALRDFGYEMAMRYVESRAAYDEVDISETPSSRFVQRIEAERKAREAAFRTRSNQE